MDVDIEELEKQQMAITVDQRSRYQNKSNIPVDTKYVMCGDETIDDQYLIYSQLFNNIQIKLFNKILFVY